MEQDPILSLPSPIRAFVKGVETVNRKIGRFAMYLVFVMIGILLYSSISKTFFYPSLWTLEMAQFFMVAFYMLGGPYSMQLQSHVRMDLVYGNWSLRKKAMIDSITVIMLFVYLGVLLYGGISSTSYAVEYGERSYSAWRPYMAPIKIIMCISVFLMLLQAIAVWIRDIATVIYGSETEANS
ncbi:putative TRAP-type C4-dicarboxylate transport system, small permease component [Vibrio nigripulchritudo SOn1]|uniref:TRAP transporter small permease protein n=1 Tax=Vibrio nigripulchritudo SOn1 TaxID=1238450 RepID=A0AAV2VJ95_9VIBR|nr:TRAP transporter small permease subunit [Vibrio nigripulchritudo]CCO44804.1 putative TRAP-type C4-dicarboxylate transport system, small permease component [Vibrio nigripulchritudo SOn1]